MTDRILEIAITDDVQNEQGDIGPVFAVSIYKEKDGSYIWDTEIPFGQFLTLDEALTRAVLVTNEFVHYPFDEVRFNLE